MPDRHQSAGLREEVASTGDRRFDQIGQPPQAVDLELQRVQHGSECARAAIGRQWGSVEPFGDHLDLIGLDEQHLCLWIDKPADQPDTDVAVDSGPVSAHPDTAPIPGTDRQGGEGYSRQAALRPAQGSAFQDDRRNAVGAQKRGGPLAQLLAFLADDDRRLTGQAFGQVFQGTMAEPAGGRNDGRVIRHIVVDPDVEDRRRLGGAKQAVQVLGLWLISVVLYDLALLGALVADDGGVFTHQVFPWLLVANPADAFRLVSMVAGDAALMTSGMQAGETVPAWAPVASILIWPAVALSIAWLRIRRLEP